MNVFVCIEQNKEIHDDKDKTQNKKNNNNNEITTWDSHSHTNPFSWYFFWSQWLFEVIQCYFVEGRKQKWFIAKLKIATQKKEKNLFLGKYLFI